MSYLSLRTPTLCALALLAASAGQTVQAKRAPGYDRPAAVSRSLCENGVAAPGSEADNKVLAGSRWLIKYKTDGEPPRSYEFRLLPDGHMRNAHPNERTPDNDLWESKGPQVKLMFNDGYAVYTGVLNSNATQIKGQAENRVGNRWPWTATRLAPCLP